MDEKLDKLIKNLRGLGYKDYVLSIQDKNIVIKFPNTKELHHNEKMKLINNFNVTVDVTDDEITIVY